MSASPWTSALAWLRDGETSTLVAVVAHRGSVPGTTGAKMVVSANACAGTVGGGVAEQTLIERARRLGGVAELVDFNHSDPASGSICSGVQTCALIRLGAKAVPTLEAIVAALDSGAVGVLRLGPSGLSFTSSQRRPRAFKRSGETWSSVETLGRLDTLFIVGGGHVALALSRVIATLPFRIVVLDDRESLATMAENDYADETRVIDYAEVTNHVDQGDASYVVIMTHAHTRDQDVLGRLLGGDYRYLGMLGSRAKVAEVFANLVADGAPRERLGRVHAPLGVPIGSHTPEEIAISIAAEIVAVHNRAAPATGTREAGTR